MSRSISTEYINVYRRILLSEQLHPRLEMLSHFADGLTPRVSSTYIAGILGYRINYIRVTSQFHKNGRNGNFNGRIELNDN